jgi:hypothetical protein
MYIADPYYSMGLLPDQGKLLKNRLRAVLAPLCSILADFSA